MCRVVRTILRRGAGAQARGIAGRIGHPDRPFDVATLRAAWVAHESKMRAFLDSLGEEGIGRVFEYTALNGKHGSSAFRDMLQHLVNHGSYHRGQVTTMIRQLGGTPAKGQDLIAYYRATGR